MAWTSHKPQVKSGRRSSLRWIKSVLSAKTKMTQIVEIEEQNDQQMKKTGGVPSASAASSEEAPTKSPARRHQQRQQRRKPSMSREQESLMSYVPMYLKPYLYPYHGEFCYTPIFQPRFIAQVMAEGFLPVATQGMLLPKLHTQRCVIRLPDELHISKSTRKKTKRFTISVNQRFEEVIQGCHDQHGSHCWLYPPLVDAFREMIEAGKIEASIMDEETGKPLPGRSWTVRLYTIEVWNQETGALAGGELGYSIGSIYTSLTGFTKEDSAGSVQLAALGRLLAEKGFHMWDLGMDMEYKRGIGSHLMPRETFVQEVHRVRETHGHLVLPAGEPAQNCKDVIDRNQPKTQQNQQQQQQKKKAPKKKDSKQLAKENSHTPPLTEAEAPIKKRVRKSESQND